MKAREYPPAETLNSMLSYDPDTGVLTWLVGRIIGSAAGCYMRRSDGKCIGMRVRIGPRQYLAHRLIMIMRGYHLGPTDIVDHLDGNPANNRWDNLRVATKAQNCQNRKCSSRHGLKGIAKNRYQWTARVTHNRKKTSRFGLRTKEEAAVAHDQMAIRLNGDFARLNYPRSMYIFEVNGSMDRSSVTNPQKQLI